MIMSRARDDSQDGKRYRSWEMKITFTCSLAFKIYHNELETFRITSHDYKTLRLDEKLTTLN